MKAFTITYTGSNLTCTAYLEGGTLYLVDSTTRTFSLSHNDYNTLTELIAAINLITGYSATLIAPGTTASIELNEISSAHAANLKSTLYTMTYGNYTSPKKVTDFLNASANDIHYSWLDDADADIENYTEKKFKSTTITSQSIDVSREKIATCNDYEAYVGLRSNAYYLEDYAPLVTLSALTIDGITVTPSYTILDYNRIILTSNAETTVFIPGKSKMTVTLSYGYAVDSTEGKLASEYSTLFVAQKYLQATFSENKTTGKAATRQHAGTSYSVDMMVSEESRTNKDWIYRMRDIKKALGGRMGYVFA